MRLDADRLYLSPSDVTAYLACEHLTSLSLRAARSEFEKPTVEDDQRDLVFRKGLEHERAYLVAATVGLFLCILYVVQRWTASATAYTFVSMPVVAVLAGAALLDEPITAAVVAGGAIVVAGVYVGALSRRPPIVGTTLDS